MLVKDAFARLPLGRVKIFLGPSSTHTLTGTVNRLGVTAQGYCSCRSLYRTPAGTIKAPLPLLLGDVLEYEVETGNIRLLAVHRTSSTSIHATICKSKIVVPVTAMKPIASIDSRLNAALVLRWAKRYPAIYDIRHYFPWLLFARRGDPIAIERITEWKNVGSGPCPMRLSGNKLKSLRLFISGLKIFLGPSGRAALQSTFSHRAPVYAIFWAHVLYGSPLFDVYTHVAFQYFCHGRRMTKKAAKISTPKHWSQYSAYEAWFVKQLMRLHKANPIIDARMLDRALFEWGKAYCI